MIPFNILPSPRFTPFHSSFPLVQQCWKSFFARAFRSSAIFRFTSSSDSNPCKTDFIFGNRKKSEGAKSSEYGAVSNTVVLNNVSDSALWAGTLSWCKIPDLLFHISEHFLRNQFGSVAKTVK